MAMNVSEWSIRYRTAIFFMVIVGMLWGLWSFMTAPRREDTEFTLRLCNVITSWPGASAEKTEDLVTFPLEKAIEEINEVKKTESTTTAGLSLITVELEDSVHNVNQIWDELRAKVAAVKVAEGASTPYVNSNYADTTALVFALYQVPLPGKSSPALSMRDLEKVAENFRDELKLLPGVARVVIMSAVPENIFIEGDAGTLSRLQITTDQLRLRMMTGNAIAPGGIIDGDRIRFHLMTTGDFNAVEEINRIVAGVNKDMNPVLLRDMNLKVRRAYQDPPDLLTRFSDPKLTSQPCIVIYFTMKDNQNIVEIGNTIKNKMSTWSKTIIPPDVRLSIVADQPETVERNLDVFTSNFFQSVVILLIIALIFIGWREAVIMGSSIPVIIMISFGIARLFDVKLEQMSITALVIALGMLVDCSIEVCENADRLQKNGYSRFDAAIAGAKQMAFPVFMGTITTVFAFLPMLLIPGNSGEYIRSIPIVVSITLLVSWIIALTFTVTMTWLILTPDKHRLSPAMRFWNWLSQKFFKDDESKCNDNTVYRALLVWSINHPWLIIFLSTASFLATSALLFIGQISTDFLPPAGGREYVVNIWLPEGSSLQNTSDITRKVEKIVAEQSVITKKDGNKENCLNNMISFIGESAPRIKLAFMLETQKSNYAQILVNARNGSEVNDFIHRVETQCNTEIPGARIIARRISLGPPVRYPVSIRLLGDDYRILKKYASTVSDILRKIDGVYDVHDSWGSPGYQLNIEPDDEKCIAAGVTRTSIAQTLNAYFSGHYLTTYREADHLVPVYLRLPPDQRQKIPDLETIYVEGLYGKVPLTTVAQVSAKHMPNRIERYRKMRNMEVEASLQNGYLPDPVIEKIMPKLEKIRREMPAGYLLEIGGSTEKSVEISGQLLTAIIVSIFLIMLSQVIYFNAMLRPLIVMITIPLATSGAFLGLWFMDQPLGFFAELGLLSLYGVVVNGAIVLFDFIGSLIEERCDNPTFMAMPGEPSFHGMNDAAFIDCVIDGSITRVRPIAMTTLTTIGGLLTLMFNGGPLFEPLSTVLIFGLAFATILTLFVVPAIYVLFARKFHMSLINELSNNQADQEDQSKKPDVFQ